MYICGCGCVYYIYVKRIGEGIARTYLCIRVFALKSKGYGVTKSCLDICVSVCTHVNEKYTVAEYLSAR